MLIGPGMMACAAKLRRLRADFRIASDRDHYEKILSYALDNGYQLVSLRETYELLSRPSRNLHRIAT